MSSYRCFSFLLALCCLPLLARTSFAQSPTPTPSPQVAFPSGVEVVTVDVVVLDKQGQPVEGLKREDFTLKEEGKIQTITSFEAQRVPESAPTPSRTRISSNLLAQRPTVEHSYVIVFDDVNIGPLSGPRARKAITDFIEKGLRPGDEVMVVPTSGGAWWTGQVPQDKESLLAYVRRLEGKYRPDQGGDRIYDHEAMAIWLGRDPNILSYVARRWYDNNVIPESYPTDPDARASLDVSPGLTHVRAKAQVVYNAALSRLRVTLDTLTRVSESLASLRGRKNLFLVSEGFIMDSSQTEFREVLKAARRANTAVHFIDAGAVEGALGKAGMPGGDAEFGRPVQESDTTTLQALASQESQGARSVAIDTGGSVVPATGGLGDVMKKIADESRAYYLVGYTSSDPRRDGGFRKISVTVTRQNVDVRARRGYYAPKDGEKHKEDPDKLDPQVRSALDAPFAVPALPLRLTSYSFGAAADGKTAVLLLAEADLSTLGLQPAAGAVAATLETFVVVSGRDNGQVQREEKLLELNVPAARWEDVRKSGIPIRREFQLAPGFYQARLLVRDHKSGMLGTVRHEFEVPAAKGLRTSTPILTDAFQTAEPNQPPRPVPVAHRTFHPGSRLAYAYDVYGAQPDAWAGGPKVSAGYLVRKLDGATISSSPARALTPAGLGRLSQVIVFTAPSEAGEYEVVLEVRDEAGGTSTQVVDPFSVAP